MACALDLTGTDPATTKNSQVTLKVVAANTKIKAVSLNTTDMTSSVDQTKQSVSFKVPAGTNTVLFVFFPPPAPEPLQIVEDCGGGNTQPILSFGTGSRASATFDIVAS
jgi:hypothetical protein